MKIRKELKMGVFAIFIIAVSYWGINYLKGLDVLSSNNTFYAYYDKTDNIEVSSPVLLKGIKIGSVTAMSMDGVGADVKLTLNIEKKFKLPTDSKAIISNKSLLGGKAIVVELGNSGDILENHDEIRGEIDDNMTEQIDEAKTALLKVVDNLTVTLERVEKLLSDENINNMSSTFSNINGITSKLDNLLSADELPLILSNLEGVTSELKDASPMLKSTIANLDVITTSVKDANIGTTITNANKTIAELNTTLEQINSKQGSIGALLYDDSMYNNLNSASSNLSHLLYDLKENPKRYVHFSIFGRKNK